MAEVSTVSLSSSLNVGDGSRHMALARDDVFHNTLLSFFDDNGFFLDDRQPVMIVSCCFFGGGIEMPASQFHF